jgi:hypothetical protein
MTVSRSKKWITLGGCISFIITCVMWSVITYKISQLKEILNNMNIEEEQLKKNISFWEHLKIQWDKHPLRERISSYFSVNIATLERYVYDNLNKLLTKNGGEAIQILFGPWKTSEMHMRDYSCFLRPVSIVFRISNEKQLFCIIKMIYATIPDILWHQKLVFNKIKGSKNRFLIQVEYHMVWTHVGQKNEK